MKSELSQSFSVVQNSFREKNTLLKTVIFGIYNVVAFLWVVMLLSVYFLVANQRDRVSALRKFVKSRTPAYQFVENRNL